MDSVLMFTTTNRQSIKYCSQTMNINHILGTMRRGNKGQKRGTLSGTQTSLRENREAPNEMPSNLHPHLLFPPARSKCLQLRCSGWPSTPWDKQVCSSFSHACCPIADVGNHVETPLFLWCPSIMLSVPYSRTEMIAILISSMLQRRFCGSWLFAVSL